MVRTVNATNEGTLLVADKDIDSSKMCSLTWAIMFIRMIAKVNKTTSIYFLDSNMPMLVSTPALIKPTLVRHQR